jgi:tellurite resistance protein TerC
MPAPVEITAWHWVGFVLCVLLLLALDLGVFHRRSREVRFCEAVAWTAFWMFLSLLFAAALVPVAGHRGAVQFVTGYFIELSLSMDNVFVIALIFSYFRVPAGYQHRVLYWGILGALVMRGFMIGVGVALINRFEWVLYVFGLILLVAGFRMLIGRGVGVDPERSLPARLARRVLPLSSEFDGPRFVSRRNGRRIFTMLFLALLMVETSDLLFAVDSIPAVFGVTRNSFIVFTSNVFAVLGLRSLYFVLAGAIGLFRYLKFGISGVLLFIGVKMLIDPHDRPPLWFQYDIPDGAALVVVGGIIALAILVSIIAARGEAARGARSA